MSNKIKTIICFLLPPRYTGGPLNVSTRLIWGQLKHEAFRAWYLARLFLLHGRFILKINGRKVEYIPNTISYKANGRMVRFSVYGNHKKWPCANKTEGIKIEVGGRRFPCLVVEKMSLTNITKAGGETTFMFKM